MQIGYRLVLAGMLVVMAFNSIRQDIMGKEKYMQVVDLFWVDKSITIPIALIMLVCAWKITRDMKYLIDMPKEARGLPDIGVVANVSHMMAHLKFLSDRDMVATQLLRRVQGQFPDVKDETMVLINEYMQEGEDYVKENQHCDCGECEASDRCSKAQQSG